MQSGTSYTKKQQDILERLNLVIEQQDIHIRINEDASLEQIGTEFSLDIEHDELGNLVGIGVCVNNLCLYFTKITSSLKCWIEWSKIIAHNGVSDLECLRMWGINVRDEQLAHDTMLIEHIIDSSQRDYSLKALAKSKLNIVYPSYDEIVGKHKKECKRSVCKCQRATLDKQPLELVAAYNSLDTYCTYQLYLLQKKGLNI